MTRFDERIQEIKELKKTLEEGQFFLGYENKLLIIKLLEKHMESLTSMYRGRIQILLEIAVRAYLYDHSEAREELLRPYMVSADERRYVEDVWKALATLRPPDYLPSED